MKKLWIYYIIFVIVSCNKIESPLPEEFGKFDWSLYPGDPATYSSTYYNISNPEENGFNPGAAGTNHQGFNLGVGFLNGMPEKIGTWEFSYISESERKYEDDFHTTPPSARRLRRRPADGKVFDSALA